MRVEPFQEANGRTVTIRTPPILLHRMSDLHGRNRSIHTLAALLAGALAAPVGERASMERG